MTEGSSTPTPEEPTSTSTMWELPSGIEHDIEHGAFGVGVWGVGV